MASSVETMAPGNSISIIQIQSMTSITGLIGDWGKFQRRTVFLVFLCKIPAAFFMACIIFTAPFAKDGEYVCEQPEFNASDSECNKYVFLNTSTDYSLVTQFSLVGSRKIWIAVTQFSHLFGVLVGGIIATKLLEGYALNII